jgi:DNA-binding response OmpR family regulator
VTRRFGKAGARRIVVVDDDGDVVERLGQLLEDEYEVLATTDWGELNKLFFREGCDLVLMDVNLPVLRGDRLVSILRGAHGQAKRTPILYFSSADEEEMKRLVAQTGADGYLAKSLRGADLLAAISRHLPATAG